MAMLRRLVPEMIALSLLASSAAPLAAQGGLLDRLARAAERVYAASVELGMADAATLDLEASGLATVPLGPVTFGLSAIEVKDSMGVRIRAYLYNPAGEAVSLPLLDADEFVLVDGRGSRIARIGDPKVEGLRRGAGEIVVPALERVAVTLLFQAPPPGAAVGALTVGSFGVIQGIPLQAGSPAPTTAATDAAAAETGAYSEGPPAAPSAAGSHGSEAASDPANSASSPGDRAPASGSAESRGSIPLANTWVYQTMSFQHEDGSMEDASMDVWGAIAFNRDGTYKQHLRIGEFNNIYYGTYRVSGDEIHLTHHETDGTSNTDVLRFGQSGVWLSLTHGTGAPGELTIYYGLQLAGSCDGDGNCARVPADFSHTP